MAGSLIVAAASGQGSISLGGTQNVWDLFWVLTTPGPLVKLSGFIDPRRVFMAGWIALGFAAGGGFPASASWHTYVDVTAGDHVAPNFEAFTGADTLFWDLTSGTVMRLEVDWL